MEAIREPVQECIERLRSLLTILIEPGRLAGAEDAEAVTVARWMEDIGRLADTGRIIAAGEVADRCTSVPTPTTLADRFGCATPAELMERVARITPETARARMKLGLQTRPGITLSGNVVPAEYDAVRQGLSTGRLGVDSAMMITRMLAKAKVGIPTDMLELHRQAEHELVCAAIGVSPEPDAPALPPAPPSDTAVHVETWNQLLTADGREPRVVFESRGFSLKKERNGLIPVGGGLLPEVAGQVQAVLDAMTNAHQSVKFLTGEQRAALKADGAILEEGPRDPRTRAQRQHDALDAVFSLAGRSGELPTVGGASATMVVTVLDDDFASRRGVGHVAGIGTPISATAVEQLCCANGIQPVELHPSGKMHRLGTTERCFNRNQRRAMVARDGGCVICGYPPQYTEAHHVVPWEIVERTHVDNGVLLCWYHHHTITTSGWKIRMVRGSPQIMPPPGLGTQAWRPARGSQVRNAATLRKRLRP